MISTLALTIQLLILRTVFNTGINLPIWNTYVFSIHLYSAKYLVLSFTKY